LLLFVQWWQKLQRRNILRLFDTFTIFYPNSHLPEVNI